MARPRGVYWLPGGGTQDVRKHNILKQKNPKTQKILIMRQNDWHDVVGPLRCNAFAIARFLVELFSLGAFVLSQCTRLSDGQTADDSKTVRMLRSRMVKTQLLVLCVSAS